MRFGGLIAVDDLSFKVGRGDITALIGPNGAGKTTVFNCITGFYKPTEGMIRLRQAGGATYLLERLPGHDVNRLARVARTFQNIRLFPRMTVLENLLVAHAQAADAGLGLQRSRHPRLAQLRRAPRRAAIDKAARLAGAHRPDRTAPTTPAGDLPYGDQRRLEIARAMCTDPVLLCLDEPAAGLNPRESAELNTLLRLIRDEHDTSVLLIEHDMSVVMQISDRIVVLDYGLKIADGTPERDPQRHPRHRRLSGRRRRGGRGGGSGSRARGGAGMRTPHERRRHQRPRGGDPRPDAGCQGAAPQRARRLGLLRQHPRPEGRRPRRAARARSSL